MARKTNVPSHTIASSSATAVPNDSTVVNYHSLYVGSAGHLTVQLANDEGTREYRNVPEGHFLPLAVRRILATGTTAARIIGHKAVAMFTDNNKRQWQ